MYKKTAIISICLIFFNFYSAYPATSTWIFKKRLAIIIDDMGYSKKEAREFASLNIPLAYSFLPDAMYTKTLSKMLSDEGYTIMIHMPSEPLDYPKDDPGKNAIYSNNSKERTEYLLERAKSRIYHPIGLNNHMGSRILEDKKQMDYIMEFLKKYNMFFVDSMTTSRSVGIEEAGKCHIPAVRRIVFLDNKKNVRYICGQINKAILLLKRYNEVVAIGHCNEKTYEALKQKLRYIKPHIVDVKYLVQ